MEGFSFLFLSIQDLVDLVLFYSSGSLILLVNDKTANVDIDTRKKSPIITIGAETNKTNCSTNRQTSIQRTDIIGLL